MNVDAGTLLAVGLPLLGLAGTWGALGWRIRRLETQATASEELRKVLDALDGKIEFVRKDQGARIGQLEKDTGILQGRVQGFESGFGSGRRSRTAAHGAVVVTKGGESE